MRSVAHAATASASGRPTGSTSAAATDSRRARIRRIRTPSTASRRTATSAQRSAHGRDEEHSAAWRRGAGGGASRRRAERGRRTGRGRGAGAQGDGRGRIAECAGGAEQDPTARVAAGRRPRRRRWTRRAAAAIAPNWDAPYIISPHLAHAALLGQQLSLSHRRSRRSLDAHQSRSDAQSRLAHAADHGQGVAARRLRGRAAHVDDGAQHIVSIDESPLLEGLIYVGTDDGLLQVTEDGGKNWRKVEDFPGVPKWTYVSDVFASPRDANVVFVAFNNWQRGDYKPYLAASSDDRGRTFTTIAEQPAGAARRVGRDPGSRQRQPAVRRHGVRRVRERRRRRALDAAQRRRCRRPGARHGRAEARERSRARHVRHAASGFSTTTARCAR